MGSIAIAGSGSGGRTLLTANANYYIAMTGNDSNPGTLASPWLTTQHASDFISANIDAAGFNVTVNIGVGTFKGPSLNGCPLNPHIWQWQGASQTTTLLNDVGVGFSCFDVEFPVPQLQLSGLGLSVTGSSNSYGFTFDANYTSAFFSDVAWTNTTGGAQACIAHFNQYCEAVIGVSLTGSNTQCNVTNNWTYFEDAGIAFSTVLFSGAGTRFNGIPAFSSAFILVTQSSAQSFISSSSAFVGSCTGVRFQCLGGADISGTSPGFLTSTFFPGNAPGTVDSTSSYDGFAGPLPGINTQTGAAYTLAIGDAFEIVEMNNAGANTLTVPLNATVAFEIGTKIWVTQIGAGATTIAGAVGVTVDNAGVVGGQWKSVKLYKRGTDEWVQTNA